MKPDKETNEGRRDEVKTKHAAGSRRRLVRRYRIFERDIEFVRIRWEEKWVMDPDSYRHFNSSKGWKRRQARITISALNKRYSKQPPNT